MTRAIHAHAPRRRGDARDTGRAACGAERAIFARDLDDVTCGSCRRGAYKRLLLEHAEAGPEAAFVPGEPLPYDGPGATKLSESDERIATRPDGDDAPRRGPRFRSVAHAMQSLAAYLDEGATVTSGSSESRFKGIPQGTREGRVSNVERVVLDVVGVRRAIDAAFVGGCAWGDVALSAELCRELYVTRLAGRPAYSSKRRECVQRHDADTHDLVAMARRVSGCEVTEHQVSLVVRRGNAEVGAWLERTGEIAVRVPA